MIYTIAHKVTPYKEIQDGTKGIQVGTAERFLDLRDSDSEDNIADWNGIYAENTAIYWIWKHDHDTLKGQHQYRRWLPLTEGLPEGMKVRTAMPLRLGSTLRHQYCACHCPKDLELVDKILDTFSPEYLTTWHKVLDGNVIFYSNGFAMYAEDYDRYCHWLFGIFELFKHLKGWYTPEDALKDVEAEIKSGVRNSVRGLKYQAQVFGFLSERLWTTFLFHNFKPEEIWVDRYQLKERTII